MSSARDGRDRDTEAVRLITIKKESLLHLIRAVDSTSELSESQQAVHRNNFHAILDGCLFRVSEEGIKIYSGHQLALFVLQEAIEPLLRAELKHFWLLATFLPFEWRVQRQQRSGRT